MKKSIWDKTNAVLFSILPIIFLLMGMTGCKAKEHIVETFIPTIIDNDLVVDVVAYEDIHYKIGESWIATDDDTPICVYPGANFIYYVSQYGDFPERVSEENYLNTVIKKLREVEGVSNVIMTDKNESYTTADGREALITRVQYNEPDGFAHDSALLIFPNEKKYVRFDVVYDPDKTVPLGIREVVDTATFDFGPVIVLKGFSFIDEDRNAAIQFIDSENFVTYMDADFRDNYYVYGTYEYYLDDEAVEHVAGMKEYALTKEEIENANLNQVSEGEVFIAIVFEIKGYVDEEGNDIENEKTALYIGAYSEKADSMILFNCNSFSFYFLEKEEISG